MTTEKLLNSIKYALKPYNDVQFDMNGEEWKQLPNWKKLAYVNTFEFSVKNGYKQDTYTLVKCDYDSRDSLWQINALKRNIRRRSWLNYCYGQKKFCRFNKTRNRYGTFDESIKAIDSIYEELEK